MSSIKETGSGECRCQLGGECQCQEMGADKACCGLTVECPP